MEIKKNREHILLTGGAGYIGAMLTLALLYKNFRVTVIDNFMHRQAALLDCCLNEKFTIIRGDVRNHDLVRNAMRDADIILPLACLTGAPLCERYPNEARAVNLDAITWLLKNRSPSQKIIFPTTNSGYGVGNEGLFCTEDTPLNPISLYGRLKVEAEQAILDAGNAITFRLATLFGMSPRMRIDLLVNDFVYRAVHDSALILFESHFKRNFLHVRDAVRVFLHGIDNFDRMQGRAYNVGLDDANLSKWELCKEIQKQLPKFVFLRSEIGTDPDKRNYIVSNARIRQSGFIPEIPLATGITELIKGYRIIRRSEYANV